MQRILILIRFSPTPYDVFQAYTLTSQFVSDGSCRTVTNAPSILPSPFVQTAAQSDGAVIFNAEGEQRFLDFLSLNNCTPRGEVVAPTVVAQVQNITVETTRTRTGGALAPPSRTLGQVSRCLFVGRGAISSSPVEGRSGHQNLLSMRKSASIPLCLGLLHAGWRAGASMLVGGPQSPGTWTRNSYRCLLNPTTSLDSKPKS
jgi:hypothetical protein